MLRCLVIQRIVRLCIIRIALKFRQVGLDLLRNISYTTILHYILDRLTLLMVRILVICVDGGPGVIITDSCTTARTIITKMHMEVDLIYLRPRIIVHLMSHIR